MKIENVTPIITPYTEKQGHVHAASLYRFDLKTDVDLLKYNLNIQEQKPGRTLYNSPEIEPYMNEFKQSMMYWAQELLLNTELGKNINELWWWLNNKNFTDICQPGAYIHKDERGFFMNPHVDNASVLVNFIVNLKDNISSTTFVDYRDPTKILYNSENKKNTGVIFFNTGAGVHKINVEDDERYMILGSVLLYKNL